MVLTPTIFAKDPYMRLKKKKLGPNFDLREEKQELALAWAMEATGEEEEDVPCLVQKRRKMAAPQKRKQVAYYSQQGNGIPRGISSILPFINFSRYHLIFVLNLPCAGFTDRRGINYLARNRVDSSFCEFWDEEEEEDVINLPLMGAMEPIIVEDLL